MIKKALLSLVVLWIISTPLVAQFSFTGELRPRSEYRHGFSSLIGPGEDAAFFISQRSRLNFGYEHTDVKVFVSLQDVRVWGEVPQLNRSDINSSIHEAWAEIPLNAVWTLKLGRQELVYDNTRILGNVDWAQQGRSHDLALLKLDLPSGMKIHGGLAFNQEGERRIGTPYQLSNYKTLQFAWFNHQPGNTGISLLAMNLGFQHSVEKTVFNQTLGAFVSHDFNPFHLEGSAYLQTGKDAFDKDLNAWYLAAEARIPASDEWSFKGGFEWLSGTDTDQTQDNNSFTPWFGTNHRFNGHMDYFYVGNHTNTVGLRDVYVALDYSGERWMGMAALHNFWADGKVTSAGNPNESLNKFLGTELDVMAGYAINPSVALRIGYSHLLATETMERIKGGSKKDIQNWMWAMIVVKPRFL